jgi:NAD(P)-dependent dehydrogenase (short-subunit alcohol dehydrogenase family)
VPDPSLEPQAAGSFTDRVVWVTGAASGIGSCVARRFADLGAGVGCIDASPSVVDVAEEIEAGGGVAAGVIADVTDAPTISRAARELESRLGPADVAVLGAGIAGSAMPIEELDLAEWERVIAVNLTGVFVTMKAAIPQLRQASNGSIVVIASAAGLAAGPGYAAYYASKHGAIGLMRTAANELGAEGIRVNAVCPGWVDTPMFEIQAAELGWDRERAEATFTGDQLIHRLIEPAEIADAVVWLASPGAAMVTGIALPVDGGLLASQFSS